MIRPWARGIQSGWSTCSNRLTSSRWRPCASDWQWNFVPQKISRFPLFRGRKCSFRGPRKRVNSEGLGTEQKYAENVSFKNSQKNSPYLRSRQMLRNEIPRFCFHFVQRNGNSKHFSLPRHGLERNSEYFSLPRNGSDGNSESLVLILIHCTEFRAFFSPTEWF